MRLKFIHQDLWQYAARRQSKGGAYDNVCTTILNLKWYIAGENI